MAVSANLTAIDIYDGSAFAIRQSHFTDARVLGVATAETFQAPEGAKYVLFSATDDFYCRINETTTTAAIPAADVTDGTAPELNPAMRLLPVDQAYISLISPAACIVTMMYYRT